MTSSPFDKHRADATVTNWLPGETRLVTGRNKDKFEKTLAITRTNRPFIEDFCDAANAALQPGPNAPRWYLVRGELQFGDPPSRQKLTQVEILSNERWLNAPGEQQARMRRLGLELGALVEEGGQVRYANDLR